jgi:di/tricarboxylate transporter
MPVQYFMPENFITGSDFAMVLSLCMAAIVVSIAAGYKWGYNTGIIAACAAFFIGVFFQGDSVVKIIGYWPDNIVFFFIAISLFFSYATLNGTTNVLGQKLLYAVGGRTWILPWAVFVAAFILTALGAGISAITILAPMVFPLMAAAGITPIVCAVALVCGHIAAVFNVITGQMSVNRTYMTDLGYSVESAYQMAMSIFIMQVIIYFVIFLVFYFITKSYRAKRVEVKKPAPFTSVQRKTFELIITMCLLMFVPMILHLLIPSSTVIGVISRYVQPQSVMMLGALLAGGMKLADQKAVYKCLPVSTIVMIAGFTLLMNVARKAGLVETMGNFLSGSIPVFLIRPVFVLLGAFLSFFASGSGVVWPLMFPLVPALSQSTGIPAGTLFACISAGTAASSMSPFSTGGAMTIAGCPDAETQDKLSKQLIPAAIFCPVVAALLSMLGLMDWVQF